MQFDWRLAGVYIVSFIYFLAVRYQTQNHRHERTLPIIQNSGLSIAFVANIIFRYIALENNFFYDYISLGSFQAISFKLTTQR